MAEGLERLRYFSGQLLGVKDLQQEQDYLREKARRHNRLLHGWGVVSGLGVRAGDAACEVIVEPGFAIDENGEEIAVERDLTVDLCTKDRQPWRPLFIAIRYAECETRPVSVAGGSGETVEHSRTRETFSIGVLTELPRPYPADPPAESWVVLADILLDPAMQISSVDCVSNRRLLARPGPSRA